MLNQSADFLPSINPRTSVVGYNLQTINGTTALLNDRTSKKNRKHLESTSKHQKSSSVASTLQDSSMPSVFNNPLAHRGEGHAISAKNLAPNKFSTVRASPRAGGEASKLFISKKKDEKFLNIPTSQFMKKEGKFQLGSHPFSQQSLKEHNRKQSEDFFRSQNAKTLMNAQRNLVSHSQLHLGEIGKPKQLNQSTIAKISSTSNSQSVRDSFNLQIKVARNEKDYNPNPYGTETERRTDGQEDGPGRNHSRNTTLSKKSDLSTMKQRLSHKETSEKEIRHPIPDLLQQSPAESKSLGSSSAMGRNQSFVNLTIQYEPSTKAELYTNSIKFKPREAKQAALPEKHSRAEDFFSVETTQQNEKSTRRRSKFRSHLTRSLDKLPAENSLLSMHQSSIWKQAEKIDKRNQQERRKISEALNFLEWQEIEAARKMEKNLDAYHVNFRIGLLKINAIKETLFKLFIEQEAPGKSKQACFNQELVSFMERVVQSITDSIVEAEQFVIKGVQSKNERMLHQDKEIKALEELNKDLNQQLLKEEKILNEENTKRIRKEIDDFLNKDLREAKINGVFDGKDGRDLDQMASELHQHQDKIYYDIKELLQLSNYSGAGQEMSEVLRFQKYILSMGDGVPDKPAPIDRALLMDSLPKDHQQRLVDFVRDKAQKVQMNTSKRVLGKYIKNSTFESTGVQTSFNDDKIIKDLESLADQYKERYEETRKELYQHKTYTEEILDKLHVKQEVANEQEEQISNLHDQIKSLVEELKEEGRRFLDLQETLEEEKYQRKIQTEKVIKERIEIQTRTIALEKQVTGYQRDRLDFENEIEGLKAVIEEEQAKNDKKQKTINVLTKKVIELRRYVDDSGKDASNQNSAEPSSARSKGPNKIVIDQNSSGSVMISQESEKRRKERVVARNRRQSKRVIGELNQHLALYGNRSSNTSSEDDSKSQAYKSSDSGDETVEIIKKLNFKKIRSKRQSRQGSSRFDGNTYSQGEALASPITADDPLSELLSQRSRQGSGKNIKQELQQKIQAKVNTHLKASKINEKMLSSLGDSLKRERQAKSSKKSSGFTRSINADSIKDGSSIKPVDGLLSKKTTIDEKTMRHLGVNNQDIGEMVMNTTTLQDAQLQDGHLVQLQSNDFGSQVSQQNLRTATYEQGQNPITVRYSNENSPYPPGAYQKAPPRDRSVPGPQVNFGLDESYQRMKPLDDLIDTTKKVVTFANQRIGSRIEYFEERRWEDGKFRINPQSLKFSQSTQTQIDTSTFVNILNINRNGERLRELRKRDKSIQTARYPGDTDFLRKKYGLHVFDFQQQVTPKQIIYESALHSMEAKNIDYLKNLQVDKGSDIESLRLQSIAREDHSEAGGDPSPKNSPQPKVLGSSQQNNEERDLTHLDNSPLKQQYGEDSINISINNTSMGRPGVKSIRNQSGKKPKPSLQEKVQPKKHETVYNRFSNKEDIKSTLKSFKNSESPRGKSESPRKDNKETSPVAAAGGAAAKQSPNNSDLKAFYDEDMYVLHQGSPSTKSKEKPRNKVEAIQVLKQRNEIMKKPKSVFNRKFIPDKHHKEYAKDQANDPFVFIYAKERETAGSSAGFKEKKPSKAKAVPPSEPEKERKNIRLIIEGAEGTRHESLFSKDPPKVQANAGGFGVSRESEVTQYYKKREETLEEKERREKQVHLREAMAFHKNTIEPLLGKKIKK